MTVYSEYIQKVASEKVVLVWIEPSVKLSVFTLHAGFIYKKVVPEFTIALYQSGTLLTEVSSLALVTTAGKWFFDKTAKTVYLWCNSNAVPDAVLIKANYRLFFSNGPFNLPYDLVSGTDVEYLPIVSATSQFGYEIDSEQMGIALEGQGDISFINNDDYFVDKYEKYFWENKPIHIYSWSPSMTITEKRKIYRGIIIGKSYSSTEVSFQLRDFIFSLGKDITLGVFDGSEGTILPSSIGTLKRRIYGKANGIKCVPIDCVLDGYALTGTLAGSVDSSTITGTGTLFLKECAPGDSFKYLERTYSIKSVESDTSLTLGGKLDDILSNATISLRPKVPYRHKNRTWLVSDHAAKKITATIQTVLSGTRYVVDSTIDFKAGDICELNGQKVTIRRINGNIIVLEQVVIPAPVATNTINQYPVPFANFGTTDFTVTTDYTLSNLSTGCKIIMNVLAEFNQSPQQSFTGTATFTNGSRSISGAGTQFLAEFKSRDWILPNGSLLWLEVLQVVDDSSIIVRTPYTETTGAFTGSRKSVEYLGDNSALTVTAYGKTENGLETGTWIKTGPLVVKDLLIEAGLQSDINLASVTQASLDAPHVMSLKIPLSFGVKNTVTIRDAINYVNESIIGNVFYNSSFEIEVAAVNSRKPQSLTAILDDDIISWEIQTRSDHIISEHISEYDHIDADRNSGQSSSSYKSDINLLATGFLGAEKSSKKDLYLYNEESAEEINQRYAFYSDYCANHITLVTKLNLTEKNLNEKIYLKFDRIFSRLGDSSYRAKIGVITSVKKDGLNTIVGIEDISNIYNRIFSIAAVGSNSFSSASEDQKIRNGYLTDEYGLISGNDYTYGINLLG